MIGPPGAHHGAGVIVEESEQVALAARDDRAVERVAGPHLVRPACTRTGRRPAALPPPAAGAFSSRRSNSRCRVRSDGAQPAVSCRIRRTWAAVRLRLLPLQRLRQRQHLLRGPRLALPRRRHERVEPAGLISPPPPVQRPRDTRTGCPPGPSWARPASSLARRPRSAAVMPASASSCTSEYRNRPASRARSSLAFLSASSRVVTPRPFSRARHRGPTDSDRKARSPGRGEARVEPSGQGRPGRPSPEHGRNRRPGTDSDPSVSTAASSHPDTVTIPGQRPRAAAAAAATATTASASTLPAGSSGTGSSRQDPGQPGEELPHPGRRGAEPAQPAPHRALRHPGRRRDPPEPLAPRRPRQHVPDHRRPVAAARQQPRRKQHMRHPARRAPRPPRPDRHRDPPRREHRPAGRVAPPAQPAPAPRTRKQAVTEELLDASRVVAYREHRCLRAPSRPSPSFAKRSRGGPAHSDMLTVSSHTSHPQPEPRGKPHAHPQ